MAQSVQSAQQMALATQLLQAYGSQGMAYLQAAAVTGKPLASMLSMAMLQQAQTQQQQQQQQVAAATAAMMMPKRGRGSRGGSLARSRVGSGVATGSGATGSSGVGGAGLKLKRLDS